MRDLFSDSMNFINNVENTLAKRESIAPGAWLLPGFALDLAPALLAALEAILAQAPLRHMVTPGGLRMAVANSSCGPQAGSATRWGIATREWIRKRA